MRKFESIVITIKKEQIIAKASADHRDVVFDSAVSSDFFKIN
jgi:hypothetical protein